MPVDHRFFRIVDAITLTDLAARLGAVVHGKTRQQPITGVAPLAEAGNGDVTFQSSAIPASVYPEAGSIIITKAESAACADNEQIYLVVKYPRRAFAAALEMIVQPADMSREQSLIDKTAWVHPRAFIASGTIIGADCRIEAGAVVQSGVVIGDGCHIGSNSVLSHCRIGNQVVIGSGTVIGDGGFGFEMTEKGAVRLPHVGIVRIADSCSIGSHCTIDRGSLGDTVFGNSVMIDNLCHIAHNVQLGDRVVMAGQCGISGSVTIGADVQIGGQVGIAPHLMIADGAILTARSGVTKDVAPDSQMAGFPAVDAGQFWRECAALRRLTRASRAARQNIKD
jgi:UDP-3-O-[3-hydroxymyristoyl] glucosamine N-acyltransferase